MLCHHCGQPVLEDSKFCSVCGQKLVTVEIEIRLPESEPAVSSSDPRHAAAPLPPAPSKKGTLRVPLLILAGLCVLGLVLFALFPGDNASSTPAGSADPFTNENGYLYFNESLYDGPEELTVPKTVDGIPVTNIGEYCFDDCDRLTTVKLPETVKYVEWRAFCDCDNLRGIVLPEGLLYIGGEAFADCSELEAIRIPASVETIESSAFDWCGKLKYVFFDGTQAQWKQAFEGAYDSDAIVYCSDGKLPLEPFD